MRVSPQNLDTNQSLQAGTYLLPFETKTALCLEKILNSRLQKMLPFVDGYTLLQSLKVFLVLSTMLCDVTHFCHAQGNGP